MFSRHYGTEVVKGGTYLSMRGGEFVSVDANGGGLPGDARTLYVAVSPIVALLVGPLAGLLFVIFLPLAVPLFVAWLCACKIREAAPRVLAQVAISLNHAGGSAVVAEGIASEMSDTRATGNIKNGTDEIAGRNDNR